MTKEKLCIDCKHYDYMDESTATSWAQGKPICKHVIFIYGSGPRSPEYRRKRGQACGPTGILYEVKLLNSKES